MSYIDAVEADESHYREQAFAVSLGFLDADEYHAAADEAFAEWARYQA